MHFVVLLLVKFDDNVNREDEIRIFLWLQSDRYWSALLRLSIRRRARSTVSAFPHHQGSIVILQCGVPKPAPLPYSLVQIRLFHNEINFEVPD